MLRTEILQYEQVEEVCTDFQNENGKKFQKNIGGGNHFHIKTWCCRMTSPSLNFLKSFL